LVLGATLAGRAFDSRFFVLQNLSTTAQGDKTKRASTKLQSLAQGKNRSLKAEIRKI